MTVEKVNAFLDELKVNGLTALLARSFTAHLFASSTAGSIQIRATQAAFQVARAAWLLVGLHVTRHRQLDHLV